MAEKYETVKGFKDNIGETARIREKIKEILTRTFKNYGFSPAETPTIEYEKFVKGNLNNDSKNEENKDDKSNDNREDDNNNNNNQDEAISDIFKLKDKGNRDLALRYEFTFQLKRIVLNKKLPFKRYQIGSVFRDEPVSSNRVREITQCDVDTVGSNLRDSAEILALSNEVLEKLNIPSEIYVNSRKLLNEILEKEKIKPEYKEMVIKEMDKLDKLEEKQIKENLKKYQAEKILDIIKNSEKFFDKYKSYEDIKKIKEYCNEYGIKIIFSPSLARGLSYYNGIIFEIKIKGKEMKESILGGGEYFVNGVQSVGISFGLDRLTQIAKISDEELKNEKIGCIIISINQDEESIKAAQFLRQNNISCFILEKISKALEYANSESIPYVIFIGEEEIKSKKLKLRDMKTGKESLFSLKELVKKLK